MNYFVFQEVYCFNCQGEEIYNVVYNWGAEGNDVNRPLRYGCRTPYDKSRCNHNTIVSKLWKYIIVVETEHFLQHCIYDQRRHIHAV